MTVRPQSWPAWARWTDPLRGRAIGTLVALGGVVLACAPARAGELLVFAAASLTDALREIARPYEAQSGEKLVFNFSASSTLALQIQEGAPADVFFSADEAKVDTLAARGLLLPGTRSCLLSNALVLIVPADGSADLPAGGQPGASLVLLSPEDLLRPWVRRIALAEPATVPAGIYAREYLEARGIWRQLEGKIVPVENVRAALAAVESGNVEAGIVYRTDARVSKKVKVAFEVPREQSPRIAYCVCALRESKRPDAARRWIEHLRSPAALAVCAAHGFLVESPARPDTLQQKETGNRSH